MNRENQIIFAFTFSMGIFALGSMAEAKLSCEDPNQKVMVDPSRKKIVITKFGKTHKFKILNPANSGFQMFGSNTSAFEAEGGVVFGIKDSKIQSKKSLSIFRGGEVIAHFDSCSERQ